MARKKSGLVISNDKKSGSLAYNRLDMQISQTLHMAIELYPTLDYTNNISDIESMFSLVKNV